MECKWEIERERKRSGLGGLCRKMEVDPLYDHQHCSLHPFWIIGYFYLERYKKFDRSEFIHFSLHTYDLVHSTPSTRLPKTPYTAFPSDPVAGNGHTCR